MYSPFGDTSPSQMPASCAIQARSSGSRRRTSFNSESRGATGQSGRPLAAASAESHLVCFEEGVRRPAAAHSFVGSREDHSVRNSRILPAACTPMLAEYPSCHSTGHQDGAARPPQRLRSPDRRTPQRLYGERPSARQCPVQHRIGRANRCRVVRRGEEIQGRSTRERRSVRRWSTNSWGGYPSAPP